MLKILERPQAAPLTLVEKNRRLDIVAAAYNSPKNKERIFTAILRIEDMNHKQRRTTSTVGTLLQPAVDALNQAGVATASTLGSLEDNLGLDPDETHDLGCACHGMEMAGSYMSSCFTAYKTDADAG